jgi:hypothetical protein
MHAITLRMYAAARKQWPLAGVAVTLQVSIPVRASRAEGNDIRREIVTHRRPRRRQRERLLAGSQCLARSTRCCPLQVRIATTLA